MAKKSLGHIELQWTCPNCNGINPGPEKTCLSCGSPQPVDVIFEQAAHQELITSEDKLADAQKGADIHCPYCGTRNVAGAETCTQCGGDLVSGKKRISGQVVGAFQTGPVGQVPCPRCGAENPETAKSCSQCGASMKMDVIKETPQTEVPKKFSMTNRWIVIASLIGLLVICVLLYFGFFSTENVTGTVQSGQWIRSVPLEIFGPVKYADFTDQIPDQAEILSCIEKYHHTQDEPAENATEICGTPYNVDKGSGYAEVVQDCVYQVYQEYCDYTIEEWYVSETVSLKGSDYNPMWPQVVSGEGQRPGDNRSETYIIVFQTENGVKSYTTTDYQLFIEAQPGTEWILQVNPIGGIIGIER